MSVCPYALLTVLFMFCCIAQAEVSGEVVKISVESGKPITAGMVRHGVQQCDLRLDPMVT
jgi:hypothetical protein